MTDTTSSTPERRGGTPIGHRAAARLDRLPPSRWHRRITLIVGLGAFFDLYEIFLGGVLAAVLAEQWHLGHTAKSWVIAAGFLGMFVGANVLSVLADRFGRRRMFMVNLAAYSFFSLLCAVRPGPVLAARCCAFCPASGSAPNSCWWTPISRSSCRGRCAGAISPMPTPSGSSAFRSPRCSAPGWWPRTAAGHRGLALAAGGRCAGCRVHPAACGANCRNHHGG